MLCETDFFNFPCRQISGTKSENRKCGKTLLVKHIAHFYFSCRTIPEFPGTKKSEMHEATLRNGFPSARHWTFRIFDFLCQSFPCRGKERKRLGPPNTLYNDDITRKHEWEDKPRKQRTHESQETQPPLTPKAGAGVQRQSAGRQPVVQAQIPVVQDLLCGNDTQKVPYYRKKAPAYRGKSGQNTGTDFLALGLLTVRGGCLPSKWRNSAVGMPCKCPGDVLGWVPGHLDAPTWFLCNPA